MAAGGFLTKPGEAIPTITDTTTDVPERQAIIAQLEEVQRQVAQGHGVAARDHLIDALNALCGAFDVDPYI